MNKNIFNTLINSDEMIVKKSSLTSKIARLEEELNFYKDTLGELMATLLVNNNRIPETPIKDFMVYINALKERLDKFKECEK